MLIVEQTDRIVIYVGEFHCPSVFGVMQLHWRLQESKEERLQMQTCHKWISSFSMFS